MRILIANRGEIACRIIKTCRRLNIETVAVYSDADNGALHTELADQSVRIGDGEAKSSYLNIEKIISAAKKYHVNAVHPGYGFLSENPEFAARLKAEKITFIGPSSKVIGLLGDKVKAKELAKKAKVPIVPGLDILGKNLAKPEEIKKIETFGKKVGYPLIIKAAAGGGGRGMRKVNKASELKEALQNASREAAAFFNDGRIFVEKCVENARHVEVQVLGDSYGNISVLWDRDCTVQRSHQKVVEEAPAPALSDKTRAAIHDAAKRICEVAKYENAGTVEFLLSRESFYFLEVNSRLQVEHPVTEMITGLDLVELQIKAAIGEKLGSIKVKPKGFAIEARLCAENPIQNFAPQTGMLELFDFKPLSNVRVDTGFVAGGLVSHYYDSLLAKVIAYGGTRVEAITRLEEALEKATICGVLTNIGFLLDIIRSPQFQSVTHHITYAPTLLPSDKEKENLSAKLCGLYLIASIYKEANLDLPTSLSSFRMYGEGLLGGTFKVGGEVANVELHRLATSSFHIKVGKKVIAQVNSVCSLAPGSIECEIDGVKEFLRINITPFGNTWIATRHGSFEILSAQIPLKQKESSISTHPEIKSPLPGKVIDIKILKGGLVKEGDTILLLESMKMEHRICAPHSGIIEEMIVSKGDTVNAGHVLVRMGL